MIIERIRRTGVGRAGLLVYTVSFFVVLYVPIAIVVIFSFNDSRLLAQWEGFTLKWYAALMNAPEIWIALANSTVVAAATAALSVGLGVFAAYALVKFRFRARPVVDALIFVPIVIAEIPEAVSIFLFLGARTLDWGLVAIIVGHASFAVAFAVLVMRARLARYDFSLEDAAQSLGATPVEALFRITLPLNYPALFAAGLLAFLLSFDDFYMTFFLAPPGIETLPLLIFSMAARGGVPPLINAISVIMLVVSIPLSFFFARATRGDE